MNTETTATETETKPERAAVRAFKGTLAELVTLHINGVKAGKSKAECAAEADITTENYGQKIGELRKQGVPLPKFPKMGRSAGQPIDIASLTELAESLS
jgi:hypothetical protein